MSKKQHRGKDHDDFILKPDLSISFKGKDSLKRSEETGIPLEDEAAIAAMEGDIPRRDVNPELASSYAATRLHPDKGISFPKPASLKKRPLILPLYARYAAAAVILLLLSLGGWYLSGSGSSPEIERYQLAKLDMVKADIPENVMLYKDLSSRTEVEMKLSAPQREAIEINTMGSLAYSPIDYTNTNYTDIGSQYRAPNIQLPTHVPSVAEGSTIAYADAAPKKKGLIGRVFSGFFNRVSAPLKGTEDDTEKSSGEGFLWNVAQLGVKSVNVLGDHDYTLVRDYNEKGNVKGLIVLDE